MDGWIKMPFGMEVGLGPGDFVLDVDPASPPQEGGGAPFPISAHVHCGTWHGGGTWYRPHFARCPAPLSKKGAEFLAHVYCGQTHQHTTWYGGRPQTRRLCVRCGSSPLHKKGRSPLPNLQPMSTVAQQLHGSRWHLVQAPLC